MSNSLQRRDHVTGVFEMPTEEQAQATGLTRDNWQQLCRLMLDAGSSRTMDHLQLRRDLADTHNMQADLLHGVDSRVAAAVAAQLRTNDRLKRQTQAIEANTAMLAEVARKLHEIADANQARQKAAAEREANVWWRSPDVQIAAIVGGFVLAVAFIVVRAWM